jgi:hypothetical protein
VTVENPPACDGTDGDSSSLSAIGLPAGVRFNL